MIEKGSFKVIECEEDSVRVAGPAKQVHIGLPNGQPADMPDEIHKELKDVQIFSRPISAIQNVNTLSKSRNA